MKRVTTEELQKMRELNKDLAVINVLDEGQYRAAHIPGSDNIPVGQDDFVEAVEKKVGGKDKSVVVYCANEACDASDKAAAKLDDAGFTQVYDYAGGAEAWKEAGNKLQAG